MKVFEWGATLLRPWRSPPARTFRGLLRAASEFHGIDLEWYPGRERVVVLAPHMDDEVLGCGGTIALHCRAGAAVTVVFLTDGRQGSGAVHRLHGDERRVAEQQLVRRRKVEAAAALATLGVVDFVCLDAVDGSLGEDATVEQRLRAVLERTSPQIVYLPSCFEQHPDHRASSDVLLGAVTGQLTHIAVHAYEVWTPLFPNCLVDIDSVVNIKRAALAHYQSQLAEADFDHGILGLNAYRSMTRPKPGRRYCEAFCALPLVEYAALYRRFTGNDEV